MLHGDRGGYDTPGQITTAALAAIQSFASPALQKMFGLPATITAFVVTGYMLCGAVGMVIGGFLVSRTDSLERNIGFAMAVVCIAICPIYTLLTGGTRAQFLRDMAPRVQPFVERYFAAIDSDGNGVITEEELKKAVKSLGLDTEGLRKINPQAIFCQQVTGPVAQRTSQPLVQRNAEAHLRPFGERGRHAEHGSAARVRLHVSVERVGEQRWR